MIEVIISFVVGVISGAIGGVIVYRKKVAAVEALLAQAKADRDNAVKAVLDAKLVALRKVTTVENKL